MMFPLLKGNLIWAIWFVSDCRSGDFVGWLWKPKDGGWRLEFRLRQYVDTVTTPDSKDPKRQFGIGGDPTDTTRDTLVACCDSLVDNVVIPSFSAYGPPFVERWEPKLDGGDPSWLIELGSRDWIHLTRAKGCKHNPDLAMRIGGDK